MENLSQPARRKFLTQSAAAAGCTLLGMAASGAKAAPVASTGASASKSTPLPAHYVLSNVRLEERFIREGDDISATQTGLYSIEINQGKVIQITAGTLSGSSLPQVDAQGALLLPATRDMHIHLDKTFYSGPWQAPMPRKGKTIMDMIAREQILIPQLLPTSVTRAENLIALLQSKGSTVARSHCNIDPVSGLKSLEHLQTALAKHQTDFSCEIVAFPQHGLLHSNVDALMREAMQMGVQWVGGLDPTNVDGAMEKSLDAMFQIALDNNKGVDIHLHETTPAGVAAIHYMIDTVEKTPALKGKLTISHAFALSTLTPAEVEETAPRLAAQGITIASTVPIGRIMMPLPQLYAHGVNIVTGTDSVIDHWSPFGTGSMLEKANVFAQLYGYSDEYGLSRALRIATGDILPLSNQGERVWPAAGDEANMMLVAASCSAEAVARISPVVATFHQGQKVFGQLS